MPIELSSAQNPRVKELVKLNKRRVRDERRVTLVEGTRECTRALAHGAVPSEVYLCPPLLTGPAGQALAERLHALAAAQTTRLFYVTPELFAKTAYRAESGGVLLVVPYRAMALADLPAVAHPFYAVVEGVEKPGNLGAILRTADAAGVDGLISCHGGGQPVTDLHNPNVVRASLGALFSVRVAQAATADTIAWLKAQGVAIVAATPDGAVPYTQVPLQGPVAVALGSEAAGLTAAWRDAADWRVAIPMFGSVDSLNLASSAAIFLYEVVRQRVEGGPSRS